MERIRIKCQVGGTATHSLVSLELLAVRLEILCEVGSHKKALIFIRFHLLLQELICKVRLYVSSVRVFRESKEKLYNLCVF